MHLEENIIKFIDTKNTFERKAKIFLFSKSFIKIRIDRYFLTTVTQHYTEWRYTAGF